MVEDDVGVGTHRVPTVMESHGKSWKKNCHGKVMENEGNKLSHGN